MAKLLHILAFPFPLQGHVAPMLHLVRRLLSKPSIVVTFVTSESHAKALKQSEDWHGLRIVGLPDSAEQGSHGEWTGEQGKWLGNMDQVFAAFFANAKMAEPLEQVIRELVSSSSSSSEEEELPPVSCILADSTSMWVRALGDKFGIPVATLWTGSASYLAVYLNLSKLVAEGYAPLKGPEENKRVMDAIPGIKQLQVTDLPLSLHNEHPHDPGFVLSSRVLEHHQQVAFVLINTCEELEHEVISTIRKIVVPKLVLPLGPLLPIPLSSSDVGFWEHNLECLDWLDEQADSSVIYISFGSGSDFLFDEVEQIAQGVEASGHAFLWVLRRKLVRDMPDEFYEGFISRTRKRGLVISWAPQGNVLSHKAVAGFITHCGWNSTMEAVLAGMPMLALPRFVDQSLNAKVICDDWRIGKRLIPKGEVDVTVKKEAVETGMRLLIEDEEGKEMKKRAMDLKQAVEAGSLANKNLDSFLEALLAATLPWRHGSNELITLVPSNTNLKEY